MVVKVQPGFRSGEGYIFVNKTTSLKEQELIIYYLFSCNLEDEWGNIYFFIRVIFLYIKSLTKYLNDIVYITLQYK